MKTRILVALATSVTVLVTGLVAVPATAAPAVTWQQAKVIRWIDGDTVVTSRGTVRAIGVDTPERGTLGYAAATSYAKRWAEPGTTVSLGNPASVDDRDRYNRMLRYVQKGKVDIGATQIKKGAKARYDSLDGYDRHPRQVKYRLLDRKYRDYGTGTVTTSPAPKPSAQPASSSWQARANQPGPDIDCGDIPERDTPVRITGPDYHGLDRDGDGWGCDS